MVGVSKAKIHAFWLFDVMAITFWVFALTEQSNDFKWHSKLAKQPIQDWEVLFSTENDTFDFYGESVKINRTMRN
jgi:hypothetical protein